MRWARRLSHKRYTCPCCWHSKHYVIETRGPRRVPFRYEIRIVLRLFLQHSTDSKEAACPNIRVIFKNGSSTHKFYDLNLLMIGGIGLLYHFVHGSRCRILCMLVEILVTCKRPALTQAVITHFVSWTPWNVSLSEKCRGSISANSALRRHNFFVLHILHIEAAPAHPFSITVNL